MAAEDGRGPGYRRVDDDPDVAELLDTMDATAQWEATRRLRSWERAQLRIEPGDRLLDVGCGLGDAALALAPPLGAGGELVGVDASAHMIRAARSRAAEVGVPCRFDVGDAHALDEPPGSFDVARTERTLQWLADPLAAVGELARVVRPGGLVSLIDSDWSTFSIDLGDDDLSARVSAAMRQERGRPSNVGGRLRDIAEQAGLVLVAETSATHVWDTWTPDDALVPPGCFSMSSLAADLVDRGQLDPGEQGRFVEAIHRAARDGRLSMALTMHAVVARVRPLRATTA